jgi:hypothetical protein
VPGLWRRGEGAIMNKRVFTLSYIVDGIPPEATHTPLDRLVYRGLRGTFSEAVIARDVAFVNERAAEHPCADAFRAECEWRLTTQNLSRFETALAALDAIATFFEVDEPNAARVAREALVAIRGGAGRVGGAR